MQLPSRDDAVRLAGRRVGNRARPLVAMVVVMAMTGAGCTGPYAPGPEDVWAANTALVAVDKGTLAVGTADWADWGHLRQGQTLIVERDNPPIWGYIPYSGSVMRTPFSAGPDLSRRDTPMAQSYVWDTNDFRFAAPAAIVPSDELNQGGALGIAPVGPIEPGYLRYHTNGLLLTPGTTVTLGLERQVRTGTSWEWQPYANQSAAGSMELDPATAVVPVQVLLVDEPNDTTPWAVSAALAQLWLDGRTVDHLHTAHSGADLNAFVQDRDARPSYEDDHREPWGPDETAGRQGGPSNQQIDEIWCQCAFFHKNIQFRLVNVEHVPSAPTPGAADCLLPSNISTAGQGKSCLLGWIAAAHPPSGLTTLSLVFVHDFTFSSNGDGSVAQAWSSANGAIVSDRSLSGSIGSNFPQAALAHELGHILGGDDPRFSDDRNPSPAQNLMISHAPILTPDQCSIAYQRARQIAMFPVAP